MSLGKRLQQARKGMGLSQSRLARLMGVTRNAVSLWEADKAKPSRKRIASLSRTLSVPIGEMGIAEDEPLLPEGPFSSGLQPGTGFGESDGDFAQGDGAAGRAAAAKRHSRALKAAKSIIERAVAAWPAPAAAPPDHGLASFLRHMATHELANASVMQEVHAAAWSWGKAREREGERIWQGFRDMVAGLLAGPDHRHEIASGEDRAAADLVLAAYLQCLRKALQDGAGPDAVMACLEPQLGVLLGRPGSRRNR